MPNFDNAIPRAGLPITGEASALISRRESQAANHYWKAIRDANSRGTSLTGSVAQLQRQVAKIQNNNQALSRMHPFKIYQFPSYMRNYHPANEALRLKVRAGLIEYPNGGRETLQGTDFYAGYISPFDSPMDWEMYTTPSEHPPMDATLLSTSWHEVVMPSDGTACYFWASLIGGFNFGGIPSCQLMFGTNPSNATCLSNGITGSDTWASFPNNDPYHVLIGGAMYQISPYATDIPQVQIFQYVRDTIRFNLNVPGASGNIVYPVGPSRFIGEWSAAGSYFAGDVVTKTSANFVVTYMLAPPVGTAYSIFSGPIQNIDPATHSPDPWLLLGNSSLNTGISWQNGPFDGTKSFLRLP